MSRPARVQLSRRKGWRMPPNTVKVDRSGQFGNQFMVVAAGRGRFEIQIDHPDQFFDAFFQPVRATAETREAALAEAVRLHREWFLSEHGRVWREHVKRELAGLNLACWCGEGAPCHADVYLEVANP